MAAQHDHQGAVHWTLRTAPYPVWSRAILEFCPPFWAEPGLWWFPLRCTGPPRYAPNAAARRPRAERPHAEGWEFRPGAFPEWTTPMDLPRGHWVDLTRHLLEM